MDATDGSCAVGEEDEVDSEAYQKLMQDAQVVSQYTEAEPSETSMTLCLDESEKDGPLTQESVTSEGGDPVNAPVVEFELEFDNPQVVGSDQIKDYVEIVESDAAMGDGAIQGEAWDIPSPSPASDDNGPVTSSGRGKKQRKRKRIEDDDDDSDTPPRRRVHEESYFNYTPTVDPLPSTRGQAEILDRIYGDFIELDRTKNIGKVWSHSSCVYPDCIISKRADEDRFGMKRNRDQLPNPRIDKHYGTYHKMCAKSSGAFQRYVHLKFYEWYAVIHSDEVNAIAEDMKVKAEIVACVLSRVGLPLSFNTSREENNMKARVSSLLKRMQLEKGQGGQHCLQFSRQP